MNKIRVLRVQPGQAPEVCHVPPGSWQTWYPLVHKTTELFEQLHLTRDLVLLFDEEGRFKELPLNFLLAAKAPTLAFEPDFLLDLTDGEPGEPGVGYHKILGGALIARVRGEDFVDLTDDDIQRLRESFRRG